MRGDAEPLRIATWLAPGLPHRLFETVSRHLERTLDRSCVLTAFSDHSGPMSEGDDVFEAGAADIGFLCAPSYLWLRMRRPPSVVLVPAGPVPDDPRAGGRPVYFSEVMVGVTDPAERFEQLAGRRFAFNDRSSLSGYFSLWKRVADAGWDRSFFGSWHHSGSHRSSLEAIVAGKVDAAAVDANVLSRWQRDHPQSAARVRLLETLGPFPIQPVVLRRELDGPLRDRVAAGLIELPAAALAGTGVARFRSIEPRAFDEEVDLLELMELLPSGEQWLDEA